MSVFNTGNIPHKQHFFGDNISDAPINAYKGDKFFEQAGDKLTYVFNGTIWEIDESNIALGKAIDGTIVQESYEKDLQGYGVKRVVVAAYPSLTLTHTKVEIGTTSTVILPENLNRKYLLIINHSDTDVYCSFGVNAVVGEGIPVVANLNNFEQNPWVISTQAVNGIHGSDGVTKSLLVTEGI